MESQKDWKELSEDEQKANLKQIGQAIKAHDLSQEIKIIVVREVPMTLQLLAPSPKFQLENNFLRIQGNVSTPKWENARQLLDDLDSDPFKDISMETTKIVLSNVIGESFETIDNIFEINTKEAR